MSNNHLRIVEGIICNEKLIDSQNGKDQSGGSHYFNLSQPDTFKSSLKWCMNA